MDGSSSSPLVLDTFRARTGRYRCWSSVEENVSLTGDLSGFFCPFELNQMNWNASEEEHWTSMKYEDNDHGSGDTTREVSQVIPARFSHQLESSCLQNRLAYNFELDSRRESTVDATSNNRRSHPRMPNLHAFLVQRKSKSHITHNQNRTPPNSSYV